MAAITLTFIGLVFILLAVALLIEKVLKEDRMILTPVGTYSTRYNEFDLRQYFVDKAGNLYSANLDTWELNHRKNRDLLKCSDSSINNSKLIVNSLRDIKGKKATIPRINLNFSSLVRKNGFVALEVEPTTSRHFKIHSIEDKRSETVKTYLYSDEAQ
jgi:hypothetical protein